MNQTSSDLVRRLAEQTERSTLRHVELLEWIDERHQREKSGRERYKRLKWLYWSAGAVAATIFFLAAATVGWSIGRFVSWQSITSRQPQVIILQMQPNGSPVSDRKQP